MRSKILSLSFALLLAGCANLANTIGAGYLTLDTLADTAAAECGNPSPQHGCLSDSLLTTQQARDIRQELQRAKDALDDANRAYNAGDSASAGSKLEVANAILQSVKSSLIRRGVSVQ